MWMGTIDRLADEVIKRMGSKVSAVPTELELVVSATRVGSTVGSRPPLALDIWSPIEHLYVSAGPFTYRLDISRRATPGMVGSLVVRYAPTRSGRRYKYDVLDQTVHPWVEKGGPAVTLSVYGVVYVDVQFI